jgi:hypothetical protein
VVYQVYKHLGSEYIKRGFKSLNTADQEEMFTLDKLQKHHGLLTDVIWHEALTKLQRTNGITSSLCYEGALN